MDFEDLLKDFIDDAHTHIDVFDGALLALERGGFHEETVTSTLGALHTLKGNSGMMGFDSLKNYIHQIEELLKKVSEGEIELNDVLEMLFHCGNVLRNVLKEIEKNPSSMSDLSEDILSLNRFIDGGGSVAPKQTVDLSSYLGAKSDSIKVNFKRLDDLLNLVGELVIYKTRLSQIEMNIRSVLNDKPLSKELSEGIELIGKTTAGLQEGIMKARMLPVGSVFLRFPKMIRDLAKSQGKEISVVFEGEETELDKTVIDELGQPLLHIIRNSIDHGIETPQERIEKGKSYAGSIVMSAFQESNYIIIRIKDDGRGINADAVRETAVRRGIIKPDESLPMEEIYSLIFAPGFSTKAEATDISGRGIGLDVVHRNISRLNGQIIVNSVPGKGTIFILKLPLNLAIIPALMAETGGEVYAIPMSAVDESIKVNEDQIHIINNREVIRFRERVIPVVRLHRFFGQERPMANKFYLIILNRADKRLALAVDRLKGQQEIVIKPLDDTFGKSFGIAGASILGDGRIVLIVDILAFFQKKEVLEHV